MPGVKIIAFEVRDDEKAAFQAQMKRWGVEVEITSEIPSLENVEMVSGFKGVTMLGQGRIDRSLLEEWAKRGVGFISTRTIGYDHIDLEAARELGIRVCNASYAPNGVAEFTIMMILICMRKYKQASWRARVNDFSLKGLQGRELKDLTVGVMGTGRIGGKVIELLSGFGCRILAYDHREKESVKKYATYVSLDELLRESDVITLHLPGLPETRHIINAETIAKMKDDVILVNCSRGDLMDTAALVEGIESQKIGAIGMDTIEGEKGMVHQDHRTETLANRDLFYLMQFGNVVITQHMAFYTDAAVNSMVECGVGGIVRMAAGDPCETEITNR